MSLDIIGRISDSETIAKEVMVSENCFVICIRNDDYAASLEVRKIYRALPDEVAAEQGYLRVIDESGEDYLYPNDYFVAIELPEAAKEAVLLAG